MGKTVNNILITLYGNWTDYGDHFVMYRNTNHYFFAFGTNSVLGQLNFNKTFQHMNKKSGCY